jgi:transposase-like protein
LPNQKRRTYTAEYKQRILEETEAAAATRDGFGALLRREGLYSSLLTYWRRERTDGILEALIPRKRGPKSKRNPPEEENQKLRRKNARLREDLRKAHTIIQTALAQIHQNISYRFTFTAEDNHWEFWLFGGISGHESPTV